MNAVGIDVGRERVRAAVMDRDGRLAAVAARERTTTLLDAVIGVRQDLGAARNPWVIGLQPPAGALFELTLPARLSASERERTARHELPPLPYQRDAALVRLLPLEGERWIAAVSHLPTVGALRTVANRARARLAALDYAGLALHRAHPETDCIVDVGSLETRIYFVDRLPPSTRRIPLGGASITEAMRATLGLDTASAERRKRERGTAGAGEHGVAALVEAIAEHLVEGRLEGRDPRSIVVVGNAARLPGLIDELAAATGIAVALGTLPASLGGGFPPDVLRNAGPDWSLAVGLAMWQPG